MLINDQNLDVDIYIYWNLCNRVHFSIDKQYMDISLIHTCHFHRRNFFSDSLDKLQIQPLIINLGLLLKPMYQDQEYLDRANKFQEVEISYSLNDEIEIKLKDAIDKWLKTQIINLDNQGSLKTNLKDRYDTLATEFRITKGSEFYQKLSTEVMEMLSMKFTMISLMDSMSDESFEPIPIKSSL